MNNDKQCCLSLFINIYKFKKGEIKSVEVIEAIKNRKSVRKFKDIEIKKEIIEDILNCGRLAPSAKNKQPWFFVIVSKEIKNKIADIMIDYTIESGDNDENTIYGFESSVNSTAYTIKQAPILILIFRKKDNNWIIGDNLSIGACVENMCLRATELNIGSLWIRDTVYVADKIAILVGYNDMELNCALALGYANENLKPRKKKSLKELVSYIDK